MMTEFIHRLRSSAAGKQACWDVVQEDSVWDYVMVVAVS